MINAFSNRPNLSSKSFNTRNRGSIWETPFALICLCEYGFYGIPVVWMQVNRTKVCGTWRSKGVEGLKLSYGGKGKSHKQEDLWGVIKNSIGSWPLNYAIWNYLPIWASCGVKIYMHYIRFLLTKISKAKFESIFPMNLILFTLSIFYQSANVNWMSICFS